MSGADRIAIAVSGNNSSLQATVELARELIGSGQIDAARRLAEEVRTPRARIVSPLLFALISVSQKDYRLAMEWFSDLPTYLVQQYAMGEFLEAAFLTDHALAFDALQNYLKSDATKEQIPLSRLGAIYAAFDHGERGTAAHLLNQLIKGQLPCSKDPKVQWFNRYLKGRAYDPAIAVIDYKQANLSRSSTNLGDFVQTLAFISNIVRLSNLSFLGDSELAAFATRLQARVPPRLRKQVVANANTAITLLPVNRDASHDAVLPNPTWMFSYGWYMAAGFGNKFDFPFHRHILPIFVSFHVSRASILTSSSLDYLRRFGPVGCRDWSTVYLLRNLEVPAFFSGCLTMTLDNLFGKKPRARSSTPVLVDIPRDGGRKGVVESHDLPSLRQRTIAENLSFALSRLESYRSRYSNIVTSRLHCYLPARSLGCDVQFIPKNESDKRYEGLVDLDDTAISSIGDALRSKIFEITTLILQRREPEQIYRHWREICEPDVQLAAIRAKKNSAASNKMNRRAQCRAIRRNAVNFRARTKYADPPIDIATALAPHGVPTLVALLDSAIRHTPRRIRVWVLTRGNPKNDMARLAQAFPESELHFLSCDSIDLEIQKNAVDSGEVPEPSLVLLGEILFDLDRVIFIDQGIVAYNLAELAEYNIGGAPLAAKAASPPRSAMDLLAPVADALPRYLAWELRRRVCDGPSLAFRLLDFGVVVMNLKILREERACDVCLSYLERYGMPEDHALHYYLRGRGAILDGAWNARVPMERVRDPKLLRWTGQFRPAAEKGRMGDEFWSPFREAQRMRLESKAK